MSQPDAPQTDAQTITAIKQRYQTEYMLKAKSKLGWWNVFRGSDGRLKQLELLADKLMKKDLANGSLQARYTADLAQDATAVANTPATPLPASIDYTDITNDISQPQAPVRQRPEPEDYNVNIPDVPHLQKASDTDFLLYVLETIDPFDLHSPGYVECAELKAIRQNAIPKGFDKPPTFATIVTKQFDVKATGEVVRDEKLKNIMILMHSDTQEDLIKFGGHAIAYYNKYGKIPLRLREEFMIEHTKENLRTSGHAFTPRYEIFCMNVLHHISMQMVTFNQPRPQTQQQPQQPKVSVTVTFGDSAQKPGQPKPADKPAAKAKKPAAAPKQKKA